MHSFMLPVQFLDTVLDMSVVVLRQVWCAARRPDGAGAAGGRQSRSVT